MDPSGPGYVSLGCCYEQGNELYICGSVHHQSILLINQLDAALSSPNLAMT
jgi:hypothetical protein